MFSIGGLFGRGQPTPARYDLAIQRCGEWSGSRPPQMQRAGDDHLYFSVRSFAANGMAHVLQYAFVDDRGNVVLSAFAKAPRPAAIEDCAPPEDMMVEPLDPEDLEALLARVCKGANLVAFGRVLQAGLLPAPTAHATESIDCAWRRFLHVGRQRRLAFDRQEPMTLGDALAVAGLRPLESEDAVMRALAVRDLWSWMDRVELSIV